MRLARWVVILLNMALLVGGSGYVRAEQAYPIIIDHALGQTVILKRPERIATVAWANHETPLALGKVPVGFARTDFGDDDGDGVLPWVEKKLGELGATTPVLFDEGDGIDFEAVAAVKPDVILASYSALSQADYDILSQIAPVVAYPDAPWSTDWRQMIELSSKGIGMAAEGSALIRDLEMKIKSAADSRPEIVGKSAMFITHIDETNLSQVNFYTANDARLKFLGDLGMRQPNSVLRSTPVGKYSASVSAENVDTFSDVDIVVTYGSDKLLNALRSSPMLSKMPAISNNSIVVLGNNPVAAGANPTPLSIPYILDAYVDRLAEAARKSQAATPDNQLK